MRKEATIEELDPATRKRLLSQLRKCKRPDCGEAFFKKFERHCYCSPGCKAVMWKRAHS